MSWSVLCDRRLGYGLTVPFDACHHLRGFDRRAYAQSGSGRLEPLFDGVVRYIKRQSNLLGGLMIQPAPQAFALFRRKAGNQICFICVGRGWGWEDLIHSWTVAICCAQTRYGQMVLGPLSRGLATNNSAVQLQ